ncbi:hypothetical protein PCASD_10446 [Puccinia coronata f. sp. avenae]|uniref:Indoleamine 2,3-dioxygenase n=1 Tax=Puccinia coronata f. sp. avenae TaxID=200324 RepID=A0A2N5UEM4_9BASI|nr:hypothetical protein PCASD_10972 [Puccinia coronata f. sp. avenae]PLW36187.1 hypothetical protein PCASD_10446 [Puccinia coronata f. sp. avenae]
MDCDHFLTPQKVFLGSNSSSSASSPSSIAHLGSKLQSSTSQFFYSTHSTDTTTLASADYDVDVQSGFLSPSPPINRITDPAYQPWEDALDTITKLISSFHQEVVDQDSQLIQVKNWKKFISSDLPVLSIDPLRNEIVEMRRAHLVLAFLTHAFVHSTSFNQQNSIQHSRIAIPLSLAVPLTGISLALDVPPVLTYADTVLYNWSFKDPALGFTVANIEIPTTFTRSDSERHFYKTSVLVESLGPGCLKLMRSSLDEAFMEDETSVKRIGNNLGRLAKHIDRLSKVLRDVKEGCDPRTFYWEIRPWFIGGRWIWEGVIGEEFTKLKPQEETEQPSKVEEESEQWKVTEFGGPSAGQSTLIHAIDVFLGVNHEPNQQEISSGIQDEETFMNRMSNYMPHHHRLFLKQLARSCSTKQGVHPNLIRSIVINHQDHKFKSGPNILKENYNLCIQALENLRKTHTQIVSLFIICQKNSAPPPHHLFSSALTSTTDSSIKSSTTSYHAGKSYQVKSLIRTIKEPEDQAATKQEEEKDSTDSNEGSDTNNCHEIKSQAEPLETVTAIQREILKGTGGTDLSKFLKRCKLRTTQAFLD